MTLVITMLGFALFDLAVLESRLVLSTQAELNAFEAAQAGIERALHLLFLDFATEPSWADGTINTIPFPAITTAFADFLLDQTFLGSGRYTVQLMNLRHNDPSVANDASDLGLVCTPNASGVCTDLIYVRSTGTFTQGIITSTSRTIQIIAQANTAPGGIASGGSAGGQTISGNARIAGSVDLVGCAAKNDSCPKTLFSGTAGQRNNYNDMPAFIQERVPTLDLVCPSGNINCLESQRLESLGATLKIAYPKKEASLDLSGSATMGTSSATKNPYTGRSGKATLDLARIGDGCDNLDCSDAVSGNQGVQNIYSDSGTGTGGILSYEYEAPPFPVLTQAVTIKGVSYTKYADCPSAGNCNSAATSDFFISHAFKILNNTDAHVDDGTTKDCSNYPSAPPPAKVCNLFKILTGTGGEKWDDTTPDFTKTFTCGAECNDSSGNRVSGAVGEDPPAQQPTGFKIEWQQASQTLRILCRGADLDCPEGSPLSHTTQRVLPMLIYVDGPIKVCEGCNNKTFFYKGQAIFLAKGNIAIDPSLLTVCDSACDTVFNNGNDDRLSFPKKNLLAFLTPGDMDTGLQSNRDMMGYFYAGGQWRTQKQTNMVGMVTAQSFDMGNQVPRFFQVPKTPSVLPETLFPRPGAVLSVSVLRWKECRGSVPAGPCEGFNDP